VGEPETTGTHSLTVDAPTAGVASWSWDALRYRGSGWWLDAALPRSPLGLVVAAIALPVAWFAIGFAITGDRDAYLSTHDVTGQLWFFPIHVIAIRLVGGLWGAGLDPALAGLHLSDAARRRIRRGALGAGASLGAIAAAVFFIVRDAWFGLAPDATTGLIPFDDPAMWDMAALGRPVHMMMLGLWTVEWLLFGYLLWLQIWILAVWVRELRRTDFAPHLGKVLVGDGYRHAFSLFGMTTTVSLVFAIANLGFIAYTGELIPREVVEIGGVVDFLREMSDLLSTSLLFVLILAAVFVFVRVLRGALTRAVNAQFAAAGDAALDLLSTPAPAATGDTARDVEALRVRVDAQAGLLRAVAYQREVDVVGGRTMLAIVAKALVPLATSALKLKKLFGL
jgi:hypothetical protein